jgi:acyl-CoA thioester hydrolase
MVEPLGDSTAHADVVSLPGATHRYQLRVFYEDTDAAGIVYYANYLKFIERARTEMMREAGISHTQLMAQQGIAFIVRRCVADFRAPARLDDLLEVRTRIVSLGGASIEAEQVVWHGQDSLVRVEIKLGCIDDSGRPVRLPEDVNAALARYQPREPKS